jgi:hypothetical protein
MKYELTPKSVKAIAEAHEKYWDDYRHELYKYKAAYETQFWNERGSDGSMDQQLYVQTSDAYGYIESYISSLFTRNPGVIVKSGVRGKGKPKVAEAVVNNFLQRQRNTIEDAARLALIYPMSFVKLLPTASQDIYSKIDMVSVPPWEIIVDREARRWEDCRYVGHKYYISLPQAVHKFGNKNWDPVTKTDYFDKYAMANHMEDPDFYDSSFDYYKFIEIVELFDLHTRQVYFWTPNWQMGEKFLLKEEIPFYDAQGNALIPIVPLYFNRIPDCPLDGYSAMRRIYDQIYETNLIRSFQANAVRKASRQYLVRRGALDEEQMAQITSGIDGLFVEVDDDDLVGVVRPLPQNPTPPELQIYYQQVQDDKDKGSILAPFTRGESTRASATEIAALAAYTSSEVGRLARERDGMIEGVSKSFLHMLALYLDAENIRDIISINNKPEVVNAEALTEQWEVYAQDQASTPISESVRKREFIQSIPTLQALGVPSNVLLEQMVTSLGLPESFLVAAEEARSAQVSAAKAEASGQAIGPDAVELQQMSQPIGPQNLQTVLPRGGE